MPRIKLTEIERKLIETIKENKMGTVLIQGTKPKIVWITKQENQAGQKPGESETSQAEQAQLNIAQAEVKEMLDTLRITQKNHMILNDWEYEVVHRMLEYYYFKMEYAVMQARTIRQLRHRIADLDRENEILLCEKKALKEMVGSLFEAGADDGKNI